MTSCKLEAKGQEKPLEPLQTVYSFSRGSLTSCNRNHGTTFYLYSLRILYHLSEILHTALITSVNVKKARLYYCPKFLHNPLSPFNLKINELIRLNKTIKCKTLF